MLTSPLTGRATRAGLLGAAIAGAMLVAAPPPGQAQAPARLAEYLLPLEGTRRFTRAVFRNGIWLDDPNPITQTTTRLQPDSNSRTPRTIRDREDVMLRQWTRALKPQRDTLDWVGDRDEWIRFERETDTLRWLGMRIPSEKQNKAPRGMIRWWGRTPEDSGNLPGRVLRLLPGSSPLKSAYQIRLDPEARILGIRAPVRDLKVEGDISRLPSMTIGRQRSCVGVRLRYRIDGEEVTHSFWMAKDLGIVRQEVDGDVAHERMTFVE